MKTEKFFISSMLTGNLHRTACQLCSHFNKNMSSDVDTRHNVSFVQCNMAGMLHNAILDRPSKCSATDGKSEFCVSVYSGHSLLHPT